MFLSLYSVSVSRRASLVDRKLMISSSLLNSTLVPLIKLLHALFNGIPTLSQFERTPSWICSELLQKLVSVFVTNLSN